MKQILTEELKQIQLVILEYLDKVCEENHLRYCVSYGTLIGAIRHNGFIPWDDDIDVCMPRSDYEKLKVIINKDDTPYKILSGGDEKYMHTWGILIDSRTKRVTSVPDMGVGIDIFPLDGLPGDINERKIAEKRLKRYRRIRAYLYSFEKIEFPKCRGNIKLYIKALGAMAIAVCMHLWTNEYRLHRKLERLVAKYTFDDSVYVCIIQSKKVFLESWFDTMEKHIFENLTINIPSGWDDILKTIYGDYMTLPPENKRVLPHPYEAYWKNENE